MTDHKPPPAGFNQRRPFSRATALAHGMTDDELRGPRFRSLFRGIYLAADVPVSPAVRAAGALIPFGPAARVSHATAARLYGVPVTLDPDEHVTVPRPQDRRRRTGIQCHVNADAVPTRQANGLRASSPDQVFVELAGDLPLVELVVVGDFLVRSGLKRGRLVDHCAAATGRGAARARTAAAFVRERVDSPMESRLRMLIVLAGLPEPEVNLTFGDDGLAFRRYDLSWPAARVIVEYDGRHHIERIRQWESDLARRESIDDDGWRILIVIAKDVYTTPGATLERIHRVLRQRRQPGTPHALADRWRSHFPGRD